MARLRRWMTCMRAPVIKNVSSRTHPPAGSRVPHVGCSRTAAAALLIVTLLVGAVLMHGGRITISNVGDKQQAAAHRCAQETGPEKLLAAKNVKPICPLALAVLFSVEGRVGVRAHHSLELNHACVRLER